MRDEDRLADYRRKRDATRTPEPVPEQDTEPSEGGDGIFVVQEHHARRLHWDFRLERDGVLVSWAVPKGVPEDPATNHLAVHVEDHPLEYATFHGEIPKGEYGGGQVSIWDHGTYEVSKWTDREVKVVLHGERLHGGYVLFATDRDAASGPGKFTKNWMIHRERLPLPPPLKPMFASPGRPADRDLDNWAVEMKWDGVRALAYCENGVTRLISRTGKEITGTYPEIGGLARAIGRKQVLVDGEVVAFGPSGQPEFETLQPRMHVSSRAQAERLARTTPVTFLAFDVLQLDGRPLMSLPYGERRQILESLIPNAPHWLSPPVFSGPDLEAVLAASADNGLEGVVAKRLDSRYEPGVRSGDWLKVKNQLSQEVVIAGWKPGKGNREGLIGSVLVGVYEYPPFDTTPAHPSETTPASSPAPASPDRSPAPTSPSDPASTSPTSPAPASPSDPAPASPTRQYGQLLYCGHVGTGFTDKTLRLLTAKLEPLRRPDSPFDGPVPPEYARPAVWVEPRLVIEVSFERWTRAGRMRAPAFRGLRDDKDPAEVVRET